MFSALDKGVVDAADWATISMNERMGFHAVAKNPTKVFHSMPVQEFSVNAAAWKALPDDLKAIVQSSTREWTWDQVQRVAVDDVRVLKELSRQGRQARSSGTTRRWSRCASLRTKTWEDWSKKTPLAKTGLRLATCLAQGPGRRGMSDGGGSRGARAETGSRPRWRGSALQSTGSTPGSPGSGAPPSSS